jgi:hypothetical protein
VSDEPAAAPARKSRFAWLRAASDRVPTAWFAAIGTGAFLIATAAFGGLATAAHVNDMRSLTVERAVLIDELPGSGTTPQDGQRVLAVVVDVENNWTEPLSSVDRLNGIEASFSVEGLGDPSASARMDDATGSPLLQPGVPAQLVYTWAVDADDYAAGDTLEVTLYDLSLYTASFVQKGTYWQEPVPAATLTLTITDVGAGVDEEPGDEEAGDEEAGDEG